MDSNQRRVQTFSMKTGACTLIVSENGGRITHFSANEKNILVDAGIQTGSTFWPSPQSLWQWPPPAELDDAPYELVEHSSQRICLRSPVEPQLGIQVTKVFSPIANGFNVAYVIANVLGDIVSMAPWEISRVSGGLSFYRSATPPEAHSTCDAVFAEGCYWYEYKVDGLTGIPKLFANNSAGWLAYVEGNQLLVKTFPTITPEEVAPGEGEVEIYGHADVNNPYVEIEQQGPFRAIMPGMRLIWAVDWRIFELPESMPLALGSRDLVEFVEAEVLAGEALQAI
ncbi:DUF4380 domain-containing protein [Teredinibacter turnerae]|uniref:DUF4380 domain-containing protein n=1 Tax=Teredinibacter turnerae TaxID=2426 RepID=UPI00036F3F27|nr:DUF4380 domain-containing protein [Teredinibacter turnerae]